jgi:DnaJ-class molecular chaperone
MGVDIQALAVLAHECGDCNGAGGETETSGSGDTKVEVWRQCTTCGGSGSR